MTDQLAKIARLAEIAAWARTQPSPAPPAPPARRPAAARRRAVVDRSDIRAALAENATASSRSLARRFGVDYSVVSRERDAMGIPRLPTGREPKTARNAAVAEAVRGGRSCADVGLEFKLSPSRVHQIAKAARQ